MDTNNDIAVKLTKNSFVQHVFNFDDDTKNSILNVIQYVLIAIIPITILNKGIETLICQDCDQSKGNIELLAEILGQTIMLFLGIFFIHRLITFVPTYSGRTYGSLNLFNLILFFFVMVYDLDGNLGKKVKILMNRTEEVWGGAPPAQQQPVKNAKQNVITSSQPISGQGLPPALPTHQESRADYVLQQQQMQAPQTAVQNSITGDSAYGGPHVPKQGMDAPPQQEPLAASDALSGGFGGSPW
jgi:hypothetical protein